MKRVFGVLAALLAGALLIAAWPAWQLYREIQKGARGGPDPSTRTTPSSTP